MGHKSNMKASLRGITQHVLHPKNDAKQSRRSNKLIMEIFRISALVAFYYIFSIGLTFYNKWMFKRFHFPLMTSCLHFLSVFVYCGLVRAMCAKCRESTPTLEWNMYFKKIFLTGFATALDIGLSNWSFVFITVSLYTMVKSTAVIFILFFALVLKLEQWRYSLILVVFLISGGLFMFVYETTQFNLEGFILVLTASFLGGIRWTLSQSLTQKTELRNPIDLTYHLQPTMFVGLFPLALAHEGLDFFTSERLFAARTFLDAAPASAMIAFGGLIAFLLSFSEYLLLSNTSSLTLSICGILKEIITLVLATRYNGDKMTFLNWAGFAICLLGICCHVYLKYKHAKEPRSAEDESIQLKLLENIQIASDSESEDELFNVQHR